MTQTQPETRGGAIGEGARFCLCESYARVTERAALAGARWLGRAEQETAEDDACDRDASRARPASDRRRRS